MRVIIDADTLAFASAAMAEEFDVTQACWNVDKGLESLLARLNNNNVTLYLTGSTNFRYSVFPEYKLSRRNVPRPKHLQSVKDYLVAEYAAITSENCEADDLCGVDQCKSEANHEETMICHIDKDIDMIPGLHFSPAINRLGVEIRPERQYVVSPTDAIRFFYTQLLTGDSTDGIKGAKGIGKVNAEKILRGLTTEKELFEAAYDYFSCEEEMLMNGQLLWIWRKPNDIWKLPVFE